MLSRGRRCPGGPAVTSVLVPVLLEKPNCGVKCSNDEKGESAGASTTFFLTHTFSFHGFMWGRKIFFFKNYYFFPVVCVSHRVKRLTLLITGLGLLSVVALHALPAPTWLHSRTFHSVPLNCWVGMNYSTCIDEGTWK